MTTDQERDCMRFNPFDERGDPDAKILFDGMQTARKLGPCCICFETIWVGERTRRQSAIINRKPASCRMCEACCAAMALSWTDGGEEIERRRGIGISRASKTG